jgi:hypothetical protein
MKRNLRSSTAAAAIVAFLCACGSLPGRGQPHSAGPNVEITAETPRQLYQLAREGEKTSPQRALDLMRRAAQAGYGPAQEALARLYFGDDTPFNQGMNVQRDPALAAHWARQHVENKLPDPGGDRREYSMGLLAVLYLRGDIDDGPDYRAAREWAEKSVAGSGHARYVLWQLFERGLGVSKDPLLAEYWRLRFERPSSPYAVLPEAGEWALEKKMLLAQIVITARAERFDLPTVELAAGRFEQRIEAELVVVESLRPEQGGPTPGDRLRVVLSESVDDVPVVERQFLHRTLIYPIARLNRPPVRREPGVHYYALIGRAREPTPIGLEMYSHVRSILKRIDDLGSKPLR